MTRAKPYINCVNRQLEIRANTIDRRLKEKNSRKYTVVPIPYWQTVRPLTNENNSSHTYNPERCPFARPSCTHVRVNAYSNIDPRDRRLREQYIACSASVVNRFRSVPFFRGRGKADLLPDLDPINTRVRRVRHRPT